MRQEEKEKGGAWFWKHTEDGFEKGGEDRQIRWGEISFLHTWEIETIQTYPERIGKGTSIEALLRLHSWTEPSNAPSIAPSIRDPRKTQELFWQTKRYGTCEKCVERVHPPGVSQGEIWI